MLRLSEEVQQQIKYHGSSSYPEEGCGLLLGRVEEGHNVVWAIHPVTNSWPVAAERPFRFRIAPKEMLQAELAAMTQGLDVVGVFHSHPDCEPVASPRDLAWAAWPGFSYLITEVRQGVPASSRSWQLLADRSGFVEEEIHISARGDR